MANPPKKSTGTTPPRRKAAARKATPPKTPQTDAVENDALTEETAAPTASKKPRAQRSTAAKPRTAKRAEPARTPRRRVAESAPVQYVADTREKMGDRNFFAAVLGATAAVGAAVAGLVLALRNGKSVDGADAAKPNEGMTAHQVDGTDSSAQFAAGIADESMIPDTLPGG